MAGCSDGNKEPAKPIPSGRAFPGKYGRVDLYSYDSAHYYSNDFEMLGEVYLGDRMIDTFGTLPKKNFKKISLDSHQSATLNRFLIEHPCSGEEHRTTCAPVFRDALIFYDQQGKYLAQAQICFSCQMASFYGNKGYDMCDYDYMTDWKAFEAFISSVKKDQPVTDTGLPKSVSR
jgi:hypothetical protein